MTDYRERGEAEAAFLQELERIGEGYTDRIRKNVALAQYTTMRVGGAADLLFEPKSLTEAALVYKAALCSRIPCMILGNGSNLVISDDGIEGLVIRLGESFAQIWTERDPEQDGATLVHAYAGALLSKTAMTCAKESLAGAEFAAGIPGSVGGAVHMNAGAYGGQMSDIVWRTVYLDANTGDLSVLTGDQHAFSYRDSFFLRNNGVILSVILRVFPGDRDAILSRIAELSQKRSASQPLTMPSAGSVFRRPEGYFAGTLIQECGLKGLSEGGAAVSEKHAGFIVNTGYATATDVWRLMNRVRDEVYNRRGVRLEPEILFDGRGFTEGSR